MDIMEKLTGLREGDTFIIKGDTVKNATYRLRDGMIEHIVKENVSNILSQQAFLYILRNVDQIKKI